MGNDTSTTPSHLTQANRDAQNPQGQSHTMANCAIGKHAEDGPMHSTVQTVISPTSNIGTTKTTPS